MADDLSSLRERNLVLLAKLQAAQNKVEMDIRGIRKSGKSVKMNSVQEFSGYGPERTPITLKRRTTVTSAKQGELDSSRLFSTPRREAEKENTPKSTRDMKLSSILRTPTSQKKKKASMGASRVTFDPAMSLRDNTTPGKADHSILGYDWIAGMLDNSSYIAEKDDTFFDELNEFRRVNRNECSGSSYLQQQHLKSPLKINSNSRIQNNSSEKSIHHCSDTYVLDNRLFPVPIHGADTFCDVCETQKAVGQESFEEESYVRVSVPCSVLQSPHRVKAHRRKSFDPTDTVSLSKHCLLGWQSSKPATIPTQQSLDLRADTGISKLNALNWSSIVSTNYNV